MTSWLKYGLKLTHLNLDGFYLGVAVQRLHAVFAANAGVLVAADRHLRRDSPQVLIQQIPASSR
jgi:hypothetical protein